MTAAEKRALVPTTPVPTLQQLRVLAYIEEYRARRGFGPGIREMCAEFGWASTNAAADHIRPLRRKGLLTEARLLTGKVIGRTLRATPLGLKWLASMAPPPEGA